MALVQMAPKVTFTVRDRARKTTFSFHVGSNGGYVNPNAVDFIAYLGELGSSFDAVSDCFYESVSVSYGFYDDAVSGKSYGDSPNVERKGVFLFNTAPGFTSHVTIPGLKAAALTEDGIHIQRTGTTFEGTLATDLQSIHDKLQNGPTSGALTYPVTDQRGADYDGLVDAYQQHRKSLVSRGIRRG
jgi:hypothetical protein